MTSKTNIDRYREFTDVDEKTHALPIKKWAKDINSQFTHRNTNMQRKEKRKY